MTVVFLVLNECCRVLKSTGNLVLEVTSEGEFIRLVRHFRDVTEKRELRSFMGRLPPIHRKCKLNSDQEKYAHLNYVMRSLFHKPQQQRYNVR